MNRVSHKKFRRYVHFQSTYILVHFQSTFFAAERSEIQPVDLTEQGQPKLTGKQPNSETKTEAYFNVRSDCSIKVDKDYSTHLSSHLY